MISDLRGSNTWQGMTLAERGCFIDLLCIAWSNATSNAVCNASCTVPADVDALRRLVPCFSAADCQALDTVIAKCFKPWPDDPSRLYSPKQLKVWEKQVESYGKRKGAAEKMWAKKRSNASSNASSNAECIADASGSDSDSGSSSCTGTKKEDNAFLTEAMQIGMPTVLNTMEARHSLAEFMAYRAERGKPWQLVSIDKALRRMARERWTAKRFCDAVEYSISQGYDGIFEEKQANGKHQSQLSSRHAYLDSVINGEETDDERRDREAFEADYRTVADDPGDRA